MTCRFSALIISPVRYVKRSFLILTGCLGLAAVIFLAVTSMNAYREMRKLRTSELLDVPTHIFSRETIITKGTDISRIALLDRLKHLRYRKKDAVRWPGEYSLDGNTLTVFVHGFSLPREKRPALKIRLTLSGGRVTEILSAGAGVKVAEMVLEPECIARIFGPGQNDRELISLRDCPKNLIDAVICVEDRRFFHHSGVDIRSLSRALIADIFNRRIAEGGSTITQQLVKNIFLTQDRTLTRKVKEIWLSLIMERAFAKDEILGIYVNEVYLGRSGFAGIQGFGRASRIFFDKEISRLTLSEAALLAGIIRAPNRYSPYMHPGLAMARRNTVLDLMRDEGKISRQACEKAKQSPIQVIPVAAVHRQAPYFVDYVLAAVRDRFRNEDILSGGSLSIYTTLDMQMQRTMEQSLKQDVKGLSPDAEIAGVILQPATGDILAMVGGRDYGRSQFNRTSSIKRSIGSLIKPLIYYRALKSGYTLSSFLEDRSITVPIKDEPPWTPVNFDGVSHGPVMLLHALSRSYNLATVRLGLSLGLDNIISDIRGILPAIEIKRHPALLLGALDCSPMEVATLYAAFANGGIQVKPRCIRIMTDKHAAPVWNSPPTGMPGRLDQGVVYLINTALLEAMKTGTASRASAFGIPPGVCGKTGTTNDMKDSWFTAYTRDLLLVMWVGNDSFRTTGYSGATGALPLAGHVLACLAEPTSWNVPDNVTYCSVDPANGKRSNGWTEAPMRLPYLKGTEPAETSNQGVPGFWKLLKAIFRS